MTVHQGEAVLTFPTPVPTPKFGPQDWACVSRMGGFGDNLIASSVFPGLKKRYGHLEVITSSMMGDLYKNNPHIDKLSVYPDKVHLPHGDTSWVGYNSVKALEYKFFADLSHSCEVTGVFFPSQVQFYWPAKMRRQLCSRSYLEIVHDICDIPYDEAAPNFFPTDEEMAQAVETKSKIGPKAIGWVLSGSRLDKVHPEADIAITRLIRDLNVPVVLFGAPGKDHELAKLIMVEVKKRLHSLDNLHLAMSPVAENPAWPPRRICSQLHTCDLVIGPDTGPMWAVAMRDMPKILLASHAGGRTVTAHWRNTTTLEADRERVPCYPCHRLHENSQFCTPNADKNGAACISDITVDTIVETAARLIKE